MKDSQRSNRIAGNVLANWAGYFVVLVSGFILPRFIDNRQGQELLGVWDLGWSMTFYVSLLSLGAAGATSRYVARYRATREWGALNTIVNTATTLLMASATIGAVIGCALAFSARALLPESDPATVETAQRVILLLVLSSAIQLGGGSFNGIITGVERFDLLNLIRGARDAGVLVLMIAALLAGRGIVALAAITLVADILLTVAKIVVSRRLVPELEFSFRRCRRSAVAEVMGFGGKTVLFDVARGGLYQVNGILVAYFLGPAALAVYARQRALVMHVMRFVKQYANVFIPSASALQAEEDAPGLRRLMTQGVRYAFAATLPIVWILVLLGGPLLEIWMGPDYRAPWVLILLAIGHAVAVPQLAMAAILMGLGRHGLPALVEVGAAALSIVLCVIFVGGMGIGLAGAALAVSIPIVLSGGVFLPIYGCGCVSLSIRRLWRESVPGPLLATLPFAAVLAGASWYFVEVAIRAVVVGLLAGGPVLVVCYWLWIVPPSIKRQVLERLRLRTGAATLKADHVSPE